jgi:hypothetical protein
VERAQGFRSGEKCVGEYLQHALRASHTPQREIDFLHLVLILLWFDLELRVAEHSATLFFAVDSKNVGYQKFEESVRNRRKKTEQTEVKRWELLFSSLPSVPSFSVCSVFFLLAIGVSPVSLVTSARQD